jgi:serine kinase of HPr protein (carbohydrate metabolism regulator)
MTPADDKPETSSRLTGLLHEKIHQFIMLHGVFMQVYDKGVLLLGDSGVGKTSIACCLIERGHRWIADDVVVIERRKNGLYGRAHDRIRNLMHIREVGIINATEKFGPSAVIFESEVHLAVDIHRSDSWEGSVVTEKDILGIRLPVVHMSVPDDIDRKAGWIEKQVKHQ